MEFLDFYAKQFEIEMSSKHVHLIPSMVWSLMNLNRLNEKQGFIDKALEVINKEGVSSLSFSDCVLLN